MHLVLDKVHSIIGGSLGGMRVLEWGILYPDDMDVLIPIAVTPDASELLLIIWFTCETWVIL